MCSVLSGKNILLGVTAGIAAYKTATLVRLFIKAGATVKVVMTPAAKDFVTPLTLSTLSKHPVYSSFTNKLEDNAVWNNHVDLALWADYVVIAPATANTLSKMAHGLCDNLLMATYLSAKCPVFVAPAMDLDMYQHPTTRQTIALLKQQKNVIIPAESGELASGLVGEGRMAEPDTIISYMESSILKDLPLRGKKILITAGPTYEAIDPVRYIGNHSSGRMGFAIAKVSANLGAEVILISGPTHETLYHNLVKRIDVVSAQDMYNEVHKHYKGTDIAILTAAVADYTPKNIENKKIKKKEKTLSLELVQTKDILASLGALKDKPFLVGFALETSNELNNAKAKLKAKNLNLIVLNSLNDKGAGFGFSTNKVTFITDNDKVIVNKLKPKHEVALDIINQIIKQIDA